MVKVYKKMKKEIDILDLITDIEKRLISVKETEKVANFGKIIKIADGICSISGLSEASYGEMLTFKNGVSGIVMSLDKDFVSAVILGDSGSIKEGDEVYGTGKMLTIGSSESLLGRIINPLGEPLDAKGRVIVEKQMPLEKAAPGVIERQPVNEPLQTGIIAIDSLIPIGRGQRELIIGDRGTGKTAVALDSIINQKDSGVICIYVAIGQKQSKIAQFSARLEKEGVSRNTIIVAASASDPASLQYIAPYAGCAIGEYFMEKGKHVLIVYDDLSKHAWAYRQLALLLKRPSGREAYPGDIFYLHSRLLERAAKMSDSQGGGSLTALPIVEIQAGDLSAYIPTNIISITDGQIYLESDLFNSGIRPAVNVGLSVSRVGGAAQTKAMRQVAGKLKLELAQFRELATFAQFGSDLDKSTQDKLNRGAKLTEILKQPQYQPMSLSKQIILLFSAIEGFWDKTPIEKVKEASEQMFSQFTLLKREIINKIEEEKRISDDQLKEIRNFLKENLDSRE